MRRLLAILLGALVISGGLGATERPAISDQTVATLQRSVDAGYREARETFLFYFDEDFPDPGADRNPFTLTIDAWKQRQAACIDNRCRLVGERAASIYSLLETAKLDNVNPHAWLADVLDRIGKGHPINRIEELLPWNWLDESCQ